MKDPRLADLNFKKLLNYQGQPKVQYAYSTPLNCIGYCVSCEEQGMLRETGKRLELMSHGCDSADFETILGQKTVNEPSVATPIMFLLENPGRDYGNGSVVEFMGYKKQPPINAYYWTPNIDKWPSNLKEFNGNFYGPYFAYLMQKHSFDNVYITNFIKCKWVDDDKNHGDKWDESKLYRNCVNNYFSKELEIFQPQIIFCFGRTVEYLFKSYIDKNTKKYNYYYLTHPSAISFRYQALRKTQQEMIDENDNMISSAIS